MKKVLKKAFGLNEFGLIDTPRKISNIRISRLKFGELMGCSWCFPHGFETSNSTMFKNRRNWKYYRKTQYRNKSTKVRL